MKKRENRGMQREREREKREREEERGKILEKIAVQFRTCTVMWEYKLTCAASFWFLS